MSIRTHYQIIRFQLLNLTPSQGINFHYVSRERILSSHCLLRFHNAKDHSRPNLDQKRGLGWKTATLDECVCPGTKKNYLVLIKLLINQNEAGNIFISHIKVTALQYNLKQWRLTTNQNSMIVTAVMLALSKKGLLYREKIDNA